MWKRNLKRTGTILLAMAMLLTMLTPGVIFASETYEAVSDNLLENPDWVDGVDGWVIFADSQNDTFGDHDALYSVVYQDVPVDDSMKEKSVRLSGSIAISPEDPTQEIIQMGMYMCGADESFLQEEIVSEGSAQLTYHEIILDVPADAAFVRVSLEIRKQGNDNNFNFSDLRLEVVNKQPAGNPFVRHTEEQLANDPGQPETAVETPTEPQPETPAEPQTEAPAEPQTEAPAEPPAADAPTLVNDNGDGTYTVPNLFIPADAASFNGHYYYYFDDPDITWRGAYAICFSSGGNLVTITSAEEQAFIESQFPGTQGWIGASLEDDGTWKWITDEPFEYTNWKEGEPNNSGGQEGYAHLYTLMQWNDLPDDDTSYHRGYYCEWDSDTLSYYLNGRFNGEMNEEARSLTEEGKLFYYGTESIAGDYEEAFECFQDALNADESPEAWYFFGDLLCNDLVEFSMPYVRAFGAFERTIDFGCQIGWPAIGMMFLDGKLFGVDCDRAAKFFQVGLELGCIDANYGFARLYSEGKAMEPDYAKALEYFEKASGGTYWKGKAREKAGWLYANGDITGEPDYGRAYEWWIPGAQEGDKRCCTLIAWLYENGYGVEKNLSEALNWYEKAAWHGDAIANEVMGKIYSDDYANYGIGQDDAKAFSYFLKAAESGLVYGMADTADCYFYGTGTAQDFAAAFDWYRKAAEKGSIYAMYSLGYMYEYGLGTSADLTQARQWYQSILDRQDEAEDWTVEEARAGIARIDSGQGGAQDNSSSEKDQDLGYDTSADYGYDYDSYQYETQPWEDPYFIGYTQDGVPQYSYDTYQYETQPWEDPYFIGYTQDGVPQYSY